MIEFSSLSLYPLKLGKFHKIEINEHQVLIRDNQKSRLNTILSRTQFLVWHNNPDINMERNYHVAILLAKNRKTTHFTSYIMQK